MPARVDRKLKDEIFLAYAERLGYCFDIHRGIITRKGKILGSIVGRAVTINFSLPDKTLTGITRARAIWLFAYRSVPLNMEVGHVSSNFMDDSIANLELTNPSDKQCKVITSGRGKLDPRAFAKLDVEKVNRMRKLSREGWSLSKIAKEFGVSKITALFAVNGKTWKDATEPPNTNKNPSVRIASAKRASRVAPKHEQHGKILKILLKNNAKLSNKGLMKFLNMRGLEINPETLRKMTAKIRSEISLST